MLPLRPLPLTHVHPCTELGVPQLSHIFPQIRASKRTPSRALSVKGGGQSTSHELRGVPPAFPLRGGAPARLDPLLLLEVEGVLSSPVLEEDDVRRILTGFVVES